MRVFRILVILRCLGLALGASAQDSLQVQAADSVDKVELVFLAPFYSQEKARSVNYLAAFNDRDAFLPSYGVPVFNAIRLQVPNLNLPPSVVPVSAGLRMAEVHAGDRFGYLIDGVPFNQDIGRPENLNFNGFDYASISTASSANAMVLFEMPYAGALMLRSRDGSGYKQGAIELNASVTGAWNENSSRTLTSYSVAYMKDFGRLDTRISYNLSDGDGEAAPHHSMKINTGFKFSDKLHLRLILDDRLSLDEAFGYSSSQNFFQMNLIARYAATNWLDITGQWVASRRDSSVDLNGQSASRNDDRSTVNLFVHARKKLGRFILASRAGYQVTGLGNQEFFQASGSQAMNVTSASAVLGAEVGYGRYTDLSIKYRHTRYDTVQSGPTGRNIYSIGAGFRFSELLQWRALPFGRLRVSYGEGYITRFGSYPRYSSLFPGAAQPSEHMDAGVDATWGTSGVAMTINYFASISDSPTPIQSGAYTVILATDYLNNGWEAVLRYKTAELGKVTNTTGLIFSTFRYGWVPEYTATTQQVRAGLLNEIRWKTVFLGILVENTAITGATTSNSLKVRDITFRIDSPSRDSRKRFSFSVSGRNLLDFLSSGSDPEKAYLYKSVSCGLTLAL